MSADALYDEHWLLAYEANVKGWLPSVSETDHVAADPNFGFLKSRKVFFMIRVVPPRRELLQYLFPHCLRLQLP